MDELLEALLGFLLDGSLEVTKDRTLPKFLRILAWIILIAVYGGFMFVGIMIAYHGFLEQDMAKAAVGILMDVVMGGLLIALYVKYRKK